MISRIQRINAFVNLGKFIKNAQNAPFIEEWIYRANSKNNWFTPQNVARSLNSIAAEYLDEDKLSTWASNYREVFTPKKVGVVMAGNIPAVGFHDALSVLVSGHILLVKLSSDDPFLIQVLLDKLIEIEPAFKDYIHFVDRLNDSDAYIATGSDNTARYFHYYFAKKPNLIRKNRTSVAVLSGSETDADLTALGVDVLQYFGLGCRNVSKLFAPDGYNFTKFYESIEETAGAFLNHHKYFNNYEYNKSIFLINRVPHFDNGFLMITQSPALVSPISVLHYENYGSYEDVKKLLEGSSEKIQCVVGAENDTIKGIVPFGVAQQPGLSDYADSVDTMAFLAGL